MYVTFIHSATAATKIAGLLAFGFLSFLDQLLVARFHVTERAIIHVRDFKTSILPEILALEAQFGFIYINLPQSPPGPVWTCGHENNGDCAPKLYTVPASFWGWVYVNSASDSQKNDHHSKFSNLRWLYIVFYKA